MLRTRSSSQTLIFSCGIPTISPAVEILQLSVFLSHRVLSLQIVFGLSRRCYRVWGYCGP